jgi:hypothetical protein
MPPEPKPACKSYVVEFMSFKDGEAYTKDYEFTDAQLITIQPVDVSKGTGLQILPQMTILLRGARFNWNITRNASRTTCPITL